MAALRDGLLDYVPRTGIPLSDSMQSWLRNRPAVNTSAHARYTDVYDKGLRDLVADKDADIILRHDYQFETPA